MKVVHRRLCARRARARGMTLLEVIIAVAILGMVSLLIYGAFDALGRGKKGEALRADRYRQGREAISRMSREFSAAFVSLHNPLVASQATRRTAFIAENQNRGDRVDFASFSHMRIERDRAESDQAEVGYFLARDPDVTDKVDLVRREQSPIDLEPRTGGVTQVLVEDVETFDLQYLDPTNGQWLDSWDSSQQSGQFNRLPLEIRIVLVLKGIRGGKALRFQTKLMVPIRDPLTFGIPR
jgi:general secretion pathway protein J